MSEENAMGKWRWLLMVAALLLGAAVLTPVSAEDKPAKEEAVDVHAKTLQYLATSSEMAEFGRKNKAPEALVAAASMLMKVQAQTDGKMPTIKDVPEDEKGNKIKDAKAEESKSFEAQAKELFVEALGMGTDLKVPGINGLVNAAEKRKYTAWGARDLAGGPRRLDRWVQAGALHSYWFDFHANRPAGVVCHSDAPVRLVIHRPGVGELFSTIGNNSYYNWSPAGAGTVRIQVRVHALARGVHYTLYVR
jgi:hypothetical protein